MSVKQKKVKVSTKECRDLVEQLKALEQSAGAWSLEKSP
jgi:hypothetical protein